MESDQSATPSSRDGSTNNIHLGLTDPKTTAPTPIGKIKTFARLDRKERFFLLVSTINILVAVGLTIYSLVVVLKTDPESSDFTFTILLLINAGFCIFYVVHGLFRERVYEIYALMAAMFVVTMYCVLEFGVNEEGRTTIKLVRMILAIVFTPPNYALGYFVAKAFGYVRFETVAASAHLNQLYRQADIFSCLLKFDCQASISFMILVLKNGTDITVLEQVNLGLGIPYTLVWSVLGWFVLRRELKRWTWVLAGAGVAKPAYYVYKLIKMYAHLTDDTDSYSITIVWSRLAAGAIALISWFILIAHLDIVQRNFGKGLKEKISKK
ncbi:uncharacterized protein LOC124133130 [Haliotis rufescens]|uniref:uncharacterized protein LOC124133130 n=1 Tax=Haliotis rufescens TaxID=6454 RepID=UPI00201EFEE0|nr:uncharacterized protein LOC124133130 [Haliotis rufescens]